MARMRTVKPGFFTNDALAELPAEGRLLFIGLWTLADKAGRLLDRPRKIKGELFPFDNYDIEKLLEQLSSLGFIKRYTANSAACIQVVNFEVHQRPHVREPESVIPSLPAPEKRGRGRVKAVPSPEKVVPEHGLGDAEPDGDMYGDNTCNSTMENGDMCGDGDMQPAPALEVFSHWQAVMRHPDAHFTKERKQKVEARLKDGYTVERLKAAVDGCKASAYHQGANDGATVYDDLELICRTGAKVEQFLGFLEKRSRFTPKEQRTIGAAQRVIEEINDGRERTNHSH